MIQLKKNQICLEKEELVLWKKKLLKPKAERTHELTGSSPLQTAQCRRHTSKSQLPSISPELCQLTIPRMVPLKADFG